MEDPRLQPFRGMRERDLRSFDGGHFVLEGALLVERCLASRFPLQTVLVPASRLARSSDLLARLAAHVPILVAEDDLLAAATGVRFAGGVAALGASLPELSWQEVAARASRLVLLEALVNHENLGSIFRSVAALGGAGTGILLDRRSADPLYRKSIRVSMGWVLHVPFARIAPWPDALGDLRAQGFRIAALTPSADARSIAELELERIERLALVLGTEGPGLAPSTLRACDFSIRIAMEPFVDSLNVATALAIALHRAHRD